MLHTIIFDWKRTLYDPDKKDLIEGALDLLIFLELKKLPLILIGKGSTDMYQEVERLDLKDYFTIILFREGIKDPSVFTHYIKKDRPRDTLVIGDRVRSELAIGNSLGATTIWIKQGKFATEEPENTKQIPTYTVDSLFELKNFLAIEYFS